MEPREEQPLSRRTAAGMILLFSAAGWFCTAVLIWWIYRMVF